MSEILDAWRRAQAAEHEGAHLSAAHHFGWVAASAELRTDGAESEFVWPEELGIFERGRQHCMILLVASEFAGRRGGVGDRAKVSATRCSAAHPLRCANSCSRTFAAKRFCSTPTRLSGRALTAWRKHARQGPARSGRTPRTPCRRLTTRCLERDDLRGTRRVDESVATGSARPQE
jgi:hypothetical protein